MVLGGGAVLLGNAIKGFHVGAVIRECHSRFPCWPGVSTEFHWKWLNAL